MTPNAQQRVDGALHADGRGRGGTRRVGERARDRVRAQLEAMVDGFGLGGQTTEILATFDAIFRRSLDFPVGNLSATASRLTEDGTPIQFATVVGARTPSLRFVGDPGPFGAGGVPRMRHALAVIEDVARLLGVRAELDAIRPLLANLAPESDRLLLADPSGAFWIGAAFAPLVDARMRIYVNVGWGSEASRATRMDAFAADFGQTHAWETARAYLPPTLSPLGMALNLSPGRKLQGALYFRGFGLRLDDYVSLARRVSGTANAEAIASFGTALLAEEAHYPTASAVLSLGFGAGPGLTVELEFCGHCLFADDAEARRRSLGLFAAAGLDPLPYEILASHVLAATPEAGRRRALSFLGLDAKSSQPAYSVYVKPDLRLPS